MVYEKTIKALVTKGPSKMDLVTAFTYAYDMERGPFSVTFYMLDDETKLPLEARGDRRYPVSPKDGTPVAARITEISHEDNSGESFNLKGFVDYTGTNSFSASFMGYYSTRNRRGFFDIKISTYTADNK